MAKQTWVGNGVAGEGLALVGAVVGEGVALVGTVVGEGVGDGVGEGAAVGLRVGDLVGATVLVGGDVSALDGGGVAGSTHNLVSIIEFSPDLTSVPNFTR